MEQDQTRGYMRWCCVKADNNQIFIVIVSTRTQYCLDPIVTEYSKLWLAGGTQVSDFILRTLSNVKIRAML